jgi:hypothetical protein
MVFRRTMTESAQQVEEPVAQEEDSPPRRPLSARLGPVGLMVLVTAVFFSLSLAQSLRQVWNADTANITLQGWDMAHGHLLLHGWWSTDVNFYTLDLPVYALSVLAFGLTSTAPHVAGAILYTLTFLVAAWLAKGRSQGAASWLRVALVAMFMTTALFVGSGVVTIMMVPDHSGTICFFLVAYVLYDRFADRRWGPWAMLAVLTLGQIGDVSTRYVLVPSLLVVWAVEHLRTRRLRTPETRLALAAIASVPLSYGLRALMIHLGSYYLSKAHTGIAPLSTWHWHFTGTWESLLTLFSVDFAHFPGPTATRAAATFIGGFALLCGVLSLLRTLIRWTHVDAADRMLTVAIIIYLAAYEFSTVAAPGGGGGYEFVGLIAMSAVLSARAIASLRPLQLPAFRAVGTAVAAIGAFALLVSGTALFQSTVRSPLQPLGAWLQDHNLTYGLAGYWNSSPVTVYTGGRVSVRPIIPEPGGFLPRTWNARAQWFDASKHDARFVIAGQEQGSVLTEAQVENSFGKPAAVYPVDGLLIMVYNYNLLTKGATPSLPPGD